MLEALTVHVGTDISELVAGMQRAANAVRGGTATIESQGGRGASGFDKMAEAANRMAKEVDAARERFDGLTRAGERLSSVGRTLALGVTLPIIGLGVASVKGAADMEALRLGLTAVTGSAAVAAEQLARLEEIAKRPAVDYEAAVTASLGFQSIGKSAAFAERQILGVANAVALSGGGTQQFEGVIRQLRQVAGVGKLMGDELNIILETAPAMGAAIQAAFGTTSAEAIRDLGLSTDEFFNRLALGTETLPEMEGGVRNAMDNAAAAAKRAAAALGEQLLPVVTDALEMFTALTEGVRNADSNTLRWVISIGATAAAIGPLLIVAGAMVSTLASVAAAALAAGYSLGAVVTVLSGGVGLIAVLGGLSAWFVKNRIDAASAAGAVDTYVSSLKTLNAEAASEKFAALSIQRADLVAKRETTSPTITTLSNFGSGVRANPAFEANEAAIAAVDEQTRVVVGRMTELRNATDAAMAPLTGTTGAEKSKKTALQLAQEQAQTLSEAFEAFPSSSNQWVRAMEQVEEMSRRATAAVKAQGDAVNETSVGWQVLARRMAELRTTAVVEGSALPTVGLAGSTRGAPVAPELFPRSVPVNPVTPAPAGPGNLHPALEGLAGISKRASDTLGFVAERAANAASSLTPLGLVATLLSSVMEVLEPAIRALSVPLVIVGQLLGEMLVPVIKMAFPVFQFLAVVVAMVGESIARVAGFVFDIIAGLKQALGSFLVAIGNLLNKLPGSLGDPIKRYGLDLLEGAESYKDAAKAARGMAEKFEQTQAELKDMTFEDALDVASGKLNQLSEAVAGAVQGFKYQALRHDALDPDTPSSGAFSAEGSSATDLGGSVVHTGPGIEKLIIQGSTDGREMLRSLSNELGRVTRGKPATDPARRLYLSLDTI